MKNDVNVPSEAEKLFYKLVFVSVLKVNDEISRIRIWIPLSEALIPGSGSVPAFDDSLVPVCYHLLPRLFFPLVTLFTMIFFVGVGSSLTIKGLTLGVEDCLSKFTPWPKEINKHRYRQWGTQVQPVVDTGTGSGGHSYCHWWTHLLPVVDKGPQE